MIQEPLKQFDVCRWDLSSADAWRLVQLALSVAEANHVKKGATSYTFLVFSGAVWGFAYESLKTSAQNEKYTWGTYAHELGHIIGLPDLYSYAEARRGGNSFIFAGPWDIMSMSSSATMCAWSRIKAGWIQRNQVTKLESGSSITISPLELGKGILVARIEYYFATRYYLVEVRLGYGVLITEIDETKAGGDGIVTVIDAHPTSSVGVDVGLTDACFDFREKIPGSLFFSENPIPVYFNPYRTMAIILLAKIGDNYKIILGTGDMGEKALEAFRNYESANSSVKKAESEIRVEGLDQAKAILDKAISQYQEAKFTDCSLLAQNAKTLADKATIPKSYYQAKEMIETTDNRLKTLLARKLESSDATAKRDEAVATMNKSRDTFNSLQFDTALTNLQYCDWLISETERLEQDFQTRKWVMIGAALTVIGLALLLAKRKRHADCYKPD